MTNEEYCFWLANLQNIGIKKIERLLQVFGSAKELFHASSKAMEAFKEDCIYEGSRISSADIDRIIRTRKQEVVRQTYAKLIKGGIYFVSREEEQYPEKLRQIYGAPYALYVKGRLPKPEEKVLAIVGARECSPYGIEMAKYLSGSVVKEGVTVISGLARGIDAFAHEGALSAGGITFGVLGCGIDICYPSENSKLYQEMQQEGGVISEYAPGTKPLSGNFPMRNRIISGLSDGILVIEAKEKSGSLITVDMGLEQGKDVYALPGKATDRLSVGCNNLIKMGAKLVTSPKDILEELIPNYKENKSVSKKNNKLLETNGKIVYASLCLEPKHLEEIAMESRLSIAVVSEQLLMLELRGLAKQTLKNYYVAQD